MSSHKETAQKVVEVFSIIDKGTLTDARHKDTILQISAGIVSDALLREERAANMAEFKAKNAESPVKAEEVGGTSAELNIESADKVIAVHEPPEVPEAEEKPAKVVKSKKAKPEAAPEAVTEAADEEAPF